MYIKDGVIQGILDDWDSFQAGRSHFEPDKESLAEALRHTVEALHDIASGSPEKLPNLDQAPSEFRSAMWTWSQKRAREGLRKEEDRKDGEI